MVDGEVSELTAALLIKFSANTTDTRTILYRPNQRNQNIGNFTDGYVRNLET
jgi:hypothetical protein